MVCLLSEQKQNIFIWSINVLIASKSFPFWPKNSGTKQSNLIWSGNCLGQNRTFLYNPKTNRSKQNVLIWSTYYQNKSKTFRFVPLIAGTKAKQFDLLRILSQLYNLTPTKSIKCVSQVLRHHRSYSYSWKCLSPAPETTWACRGSW